MLSIILKITAVGLGLLAIGKTLIDYKKKEENITVSLFWVVLWAMIIILAIYPGIIDKTTEVLSGRRGTVGQIAGVGFVFIIYVLYRVYSKAQRTEKKIILLARRMAIDSTGTRKIKK